MGRLFVSMARIGMGVFFAGLMAGSSTANTVKAFNPATTATTAETASVVNSV